MITNVSITPAQNAGVYISKYLEKHNDSNVLLLLSGGSALEVLAYIDTNLLTPKITISMLDERVSNDETVNNFLQLQKTNFYSEAHARGVGEIQTIPHQNESPLFFAKTVGEAFRNFLAENPTAKIIGLFGVGADGHTASIFPMPKDVFAKIYDSENIFVPVISDSANPNERISITPNFIESYIDEVVLYAIGKNKCDTVLQHMTSGAFEVHELPALAPAQHPKSYFFTDCKLVEK